MATSGTIDLSSTRIIKGIVPLRKTFSVQLVSSDLSASTDWSLHLSADGTNWDEAEKDDVAITGSLAASTPVLKTWEADPELFWKIVFAGATTGNVSYIINQ